MVLSAGQVIANRYEIIDKIGSGGMAIVYRAMDKKLRRYVTFKVMREEFVTDDEFIGRFNVEARAAASLLNQHIVNVYDVGQEGNIHYIVMEYVDGVTLKDLIRKRAPFENDEILGVAIQIATALEHAHKNDIIHRDIKPQNILVTKNGISKVTDFGIARAATSTTMTTTNTTMGSVHYFSPEQARGGYIDIKSDIYSLGIVMYEMATGKMPFDGESAISIALKHISEPLPDIKEINSKISDKVINIITKATEKLSTNRYENIIEMSNDLKRALTNYSEESVSRTFEDSQTIKITDEDIEEIKKESRAHSSETRVLLPRQNRIEEDFDDLDDDDLDDSGIFGNKKVVISAILTSLVIIAIISVFGYNIFFKGTKAEKNPVEVYLPNLSQMTVESAQALTESLGVNLVVSGEEESDTVEKGLILSQNIGDDDIIYEGENVEVVVSKGISGYKVPSVANENIDDAIEILNKLNYPITATEKLEWSEEVPVNVVIRQEPEGDSFVPEGTNITLYVSSGKRQKTAVVPKLTGMTEAVAIKTLQDAGLSVDHATSAPSKTAPIGTVIDQLVNANTELPLGTPVKFVLSSGPPAETPKPSAEVPTETPPAVKSKMLSIELTNIPEGVSEVKVLVIQNTAEKNDEIFYQMVKIADLPLKLEVKGTGKEEILVFAYDENGQSYIQGIQNIDFSE